MMMDPPPGLTGFETVDHPGARILCRPQAVAWARYVVEGGDTLHAWAARDREAFPFQGRETVYVIPAQVRGEGGSGGGGGHTGPRWAVRHYVRGGRLMAALLGDRYLAVGVLRPFREAMASGEARARGIPTPPVVAAALYPHRLTYRADLVTEFVPEASDLVEALFDTRRKGVGGAVERQDALRAAGELVGRLARAGVRHRDLHAGNILLQWEGAAPRPHLLDLDRCEVAPAGTVLPVGPMLGRLQRSLRKWEGWTGLRLSEKEWATLSEAALT